MSSPQNFSPPYKRPPDVVVELPFKLEAPLNKKAPFPTDPEGRRNWTEIEREKASRATEPLTFQSLQENVRTSLVTTYIS